MGLMGAGDEVPDALRQIGYRVTMLKETDLTAANLRRFDAVLLGVRAYNSRRRMAAAFLVAVAAGSPMSWKVLVM